MAICIGLGDAQHPVGCGQQRHLYPILGRSGLQRPDKHMQPVHTGQAADTQIRQHEPLCCPRIVIGIGPRHGGGQCVNPGGQVANDVTHRQAGGHVAVQLLLYLTRALPDIFGDFFGKIAFFPTAQRAPEIAVLNGAQQVAVTDAAQFQIDRGQVHRFNRQARVIATRQNIAATGEFYRWRAIPDVQVQLYILDQLFTALRWQSLAEGHAVTAAMFHPFDAQPGAAGLHGHIGSG